MGTDKERLLNTFEDNKRIATQQYIHFHLYLYMFIITLLIVGPSFTSAKHIHSPLVLKANEFSKYNFETSVHNIEVAVSDCQGQGGRARCDTNLRVLERA